MLGSTTQWDHNRCWAVQRSGTTIDVGQYNAVEPQLMLGSTTQWDHNRCRAVQRSGTTIDAVGPKLCGYGLGRGGGMERHTQIHWRHPVDLGRHPPDPEQWGLTENTSLMHIHGAHVCSQRTTHVQRGSCKHHMQRGSCKQHMQRGSCKQPVAHKEQSTPVGSRFAAIHPTTFKTMQQHRESTSSTTIHRKVTLPAVTVGTPGV